MASRLRIAALFASLLLLASAGCGGGGGGGGAPAATSSTSPGGGGGGGGGTGGDFQVVGQAGGSRAAADAAAGEMLVLPGGAVPPAGFVPLPGATVHVLRTDGTRVKVVVDEQGRFDADSLPAGEAFVEVLVEPPPGFGNLQPISTLLPRLGPADPNFQPLALVILPENAQVPAGHRHPFFAVVLDEQGHPHLPPGIVEWSSSGGIVQVPGEGRGVVALFSADQPGEYRLTARLPVEGGQTLQAQATVVVLEPPPSSVLEGTLQDPEGAPVAGALLAFRLPHPDPRGHRRPLVFHAITGDDGGYAVQVLPDREYRVAALVPDPEGPPPPPALQPAGEPDGRWWRVEPPTVLSPPANHTTTQDFRLVEPEGGIPGRPEPDNLFAVYGRQAPGGTDAARDAVEFPEILVLRPGLGPPRGYLAMAQARIHHSLPDGTDEVLVADEHGVFDASGFTLPEAARGEPVLLKILVEPPPGNPDFAHLSPALHFIPVVRREPPPGAVQLQIVPPEAVLLVGVPRSFFAALVDDQNQSFPPPGEVQWSASGGTLEVPPEGQGQVVVFSSDVPGEFVLTARVELQGGPLEAQARVRVIAEESRAVLRGVLRDAQGQGVGDALLVFVRRLPGPGGIPQPVQVVVHTDAEGVYRAELGASKTYQAAALVPREGGGPPPPPGLDRAAQPHPGGGPPRPFRTWLVDPAQVTAPAAGQEAEQDFELVAPLEF